MWIGDCVMGVILMMLPQEELSTESFIDKPPFRAGYREVVMKNGFLFVVEVYQGSCQECF